jgi:hypothetical protein
MVSIIFNSLFFFNTHTKKILKIFYSTFLSCSYSIQTQTSEPYLKAMKSLLLLYAQKQLDSPPMLSEKAFDHGSKRLSKFISNFSHE